MSYYHPMHGCLAGALITLGLVAGAASAQPAPPPEQAQPNANQEEADRLFAAGRELLLAKKPKEACEKFEAANKLDPLAAGTKLNLGLCYEELGRYRTALKWFREAQSRASESGLDTHEAAAKEHTQKLVALVPSITLEFDPPTADPQVTIDGELVAAADFGHLEVDPGHHVLVVKATGMRPAREEFDIAEKASKKLRITLIAGDATVALDPGKPRRYAAYGLVLAGAALWGYTLYYGLDKKDDYDEQKRIFDGGMFGDPPMSPTLEDKDNARERAAALSRDVKIYGTTMFVLGAAAIGGAALLYFTAPEKRYVEATAIAPVVSPDQVGFAISGQF